MWHAGVALSALAVLLASNSYDSSTPWASSLRSLPSAHLHACLSFWLQMDPNLRWMHSPVQPQERLLVELSFKLL
jgi:hypothetical protein